MSNTLIRDLTPDDRPKAHTRPTGTSFPGLVGVELRRLWWRRLTKVVLVAVVAITGLAAYGIHQETNPENIAQRVDDYKRMVADIKQQNDQIPAEEKARMLAECEANQKAERDRNPGNNIDFGCNRQFTGPSMQDFGLVDTAREAITVEYASDLYLVFGFLAFLLGASFISAEFGSGSMGNWLTFQPRRLRVGSAKLAAAAIGGVGIGALGVGLVAFFSTVLTTVNRPGEVFNLPPAETVTGQTMTLTLLRIVVIVGLGGLGGAAIALLLRHTAGVMGLAIGYAFVVEGMLANGFQRGDLKPKVLYTNMQAFIQNGTTYDVVECDANGCQGITQTLSYTHGWVYLLIVAAIGVTAGLVAFRRRDVT